ncbi:hypothetical protein LCA32G_1358 [Lacticaseibacillus paracasei]|nr:hypothetical protein LCA32G_1358 [Lacticaseibacillus paracasei]
MLKLDLRNKDGKVEHFQETFVPALKLIEGLKLTPENFPDLDESDWMEKNAEFMASCFEDKSVTKQRILDGVAAWDFNKVFNTFNQQLFGIDPKKRKRANQQKRSIKSNLQNDSFGRYKRSGVHDQ